MNKLTLLLRRLAAISYDLLIMMAILIVATGLALLFTGGKAVTAGTVWFQAYLAIIVLAYFATSWWRRGQTIGMIAWRLKLQTRHGGDVNLLRCIARAVLAMVSVLPLGLGFLWILIDSKGRAWHDLMSGTELLREVVNAPAQVPRS